MAELGQAIVDTLADQVHDKGIGDLHYVLNILASVSSYYLAGIGDEKIRDDVTIDFVNMVRAGVAAHVEAGKAAAVDVFDATKHN